jgi:hypothetical protein
LSAVRTETGAAVRQEQEPDRDRCNDGADRDGEDEVCRGGAAWRRTQAKKWPVAGMDTTTPVTAPGASSPSAIQAARWNSALTANCHC